MLNDLQRTFPRREMRALYPGERTADIVARIARWREETGRNSWSEALAAIAGATAASAA
jgi:hypothetical protein